MGPLGDVLDGPLGGGLACFCPVGFGAQHGEEEGWAVEEEHFFEGELDVAAGHNVAGGVVAVDGLEGGYGSVCMYYQKERGSLSLHSDRRFAGF